jgi:hypothetical protein
MIRQRLRGIFRTTIATAAPWAAIGLVVGVVFRLDLIPSIHVALGRPVPGGLVGACTLVGAMVGAVNGLTLSALVMATERGKSIEQLRPWRFATWGAVATAGTLGLFFQSLTGAAVGAVLGAVAAVAALAAARRARASQDGVANPALSP